MKKLIKKIILGIIPKIQETEYDYIYSSRKVIKNSDINKNTNSFYDIDIWKLANDEIAQFLPKGFSAYYEIVGFLPNGGSIQKDYDYGCEPTKHAIYIYRITSTNVDGKVIEFSVKQVQDFCKQYGLNAVPELYYGKILDFMNTKESIQEFLSEGTYTFEEYFLQAIKGRYNEKDCYMCSNKVPEEGVVIRIEGNDFEAYKAKSNRFYERETKQLDKGEIDIESNEE